MPSIPIFPMDLFSRGTDLRWDTLKHTTSQSYAQTYPEILDLKVNDASGEQDVIGVTNWHEQPVHEKLGLSASSYVVFDYWMSTHITQEFC